MRILVVEDSVKMAGLLKKGLEREGYAVDLAGTGEDAIWLASENGYDAIVLDVILGAGESLLDGFAVCRTIRAAECQTPVLILPDDIPAHPYAVAMEAAMLAPKAEVSIFPWKEPKERIPLAVRQMQSFLRAHRSASA